MSNRVLFVCTGNICRSPFAELLARQTVRALPRRSQASDWQFASAGIAGLTGWPMDAHMAAELRKRGGSADGFRARRLTSALAHEADLLLVMSQEHRIFILDEWPDLVRRTWLLGQAARSASQPSVGAPDSAAPGSAVSGSTSSDGAGSGSTDAGAAASVNVVSALRAYPAPPLSSDSIPDPYQRGAAAAARAAARIENALHQVLGA